MIKRFASALAAVVAAAGLMVIVTPAANASNASTDRCTNLFVAYTSSGNTRYVDYAEARNICSTYWGFHNVGGNTGPTTSQGSHRVYYGGAAFARGNYICASSWRHVSGSNFQNVGSPCTLLA